MITAYTISISIIGGCILGYIYGLFFLHQRKRVFLLPSDTPLYKHYIVTLISTLGRVGILIFLWYHILLSPTINFILLLSSFLGAFWVTILMRKV